MDSQWASLYEKLAKVSEGVVDTVKSASILRRELALQGEGLEEVYQQVNEELRALCQVNPWLAELISQSAEVEVFGVEGSGLARCLLPWRRHLSSRHCMFLEWMSLESQLRVCRALALSQK